MPSLINRSGPFSERAAGAFRRSFTNAACARWLLVALVCFGAACSAHEESEAEEAPRPNNVLFISIDDLRPTLGCYGDEAKTPSLDRLAASGTLFRNAFCQMAVCAPSRASVLTGCRPDTTGVRDLATHYRKALPDVVTLPQLFKEHGWFTAALGKVHHGPNEGPKHRKLDDPESWSVDCWRPARWQTYYASPDIRSALEVVTEQREREARDRGEDFWIKPRGPAFEIADVDDSELGDGQICDRAIELMEEKRDEPFFLAVGFLKPHMPYVAPRRYWELYPRIPASKVSDPAVDAPEFATTNSAEVRAHANMPAEVLFNTAQELQLTRAYYACVSFVDAQVGRLLDALDRLELSGNTVVCVWGDHGWHLGEQGMWGKHTNYEAATRAPVLIRAPGLPANECDRVVELVDLYPTIAELCGLEAPETCEGRSLANLMRGSTDGWRGAAFSEYARALKTGGKALGRSVRTATHRYVRWGLPGGEFAEELYDLRDSRVESVNLAASEDADASKKRDELRAMLQGGWRKAQRE